MLTDSKEGRGRTRLSLRGYLSLLLGIGTILLIAIAGCGPGEELHADLSVDKGFLGNDACKNCHSYAFEQHQASRHAVTMRLVDKESMGKFFPKPGPLKGTEIEIYETALGLAMGWQGKPESAIPMQYALGSEHFAFTYINIVNDRNVLELRESYYPQSHAWLPTPGQDYITDNSVGRLRNDDTSRHCLSCHVTALPSKGITPERRFFGVGCESCHGPGKRHVEAVNAKEKDHHMEKLSSVGATRLNELCGRCHRTAKDITPDQANMTQRFAPYGLMKSRCFLESGDTLSCNTCHDPHKDASTDPKGYEKACLKCHTPPQSFGPANTRRKSCPVNPRSGCVPCHMPKTKPTADAPFAMSEHYIRVFSREELTDQE